MPRLVVLQDRDAGRVHRQLGVTAAGPLDALPVVLSSEECVHPSSAEPKLRLVPRQGLETEDFREEREACSMVTSPACPQPPLGPLNLSPGSMPQARIAQENQSESERQTPPDPDTETSCWRSESDPRSPGGCCPCKPAGILGSSLTTDRVNATAMDARDYRSAPSPVCCNSTAETSQRREIERRII